MCTKFEGRTERIEHLKVGDGFYHWYQIMELYNPDEKLPFDMSDEKICSIFGYDRFEAFADLSYGC